MNVTEQDSSGPQFGLLLDTNIVVNAAFIPNSFSDHCVRLALDAGYGLVVSDAIDTEIVRTVTNAATTDELQALAMRRMCDFMGQALSDKIVVDDGTLVPPQIPKTDEHVYQAAIQSWLVVLTGDAALWLALREVGIQSFLPLEFIRLFDGVALAKTIYGVSPRSESGSLVVRAYPSQCVSLCTNICTTIPSIPRPIARMHPPFSLAYRSVSLCNQTIVKIGFSLLSAKVSVLGRNLFNLSPFFI